MTDDQINAAIAEACGWTEISNCTCGFKISGMPPYRSAHKKHIPDYCTDLNEMHDAEKVLINFNKERDFWFHVRELLEFPDAESDWDGFYFFEAIHATARHRAEAFVRSLGKWATDKDSLTVQPTTEDSSVVGEEVQP